MRTYQFLFFDRRGRSPALDFAECADDGEAARSADRQLGLHATCSGVEVFDGDRMVLRLDRARLPASGMEAQTPPPARSEPGQRHAP